MIANIQVLRAAAAISVVLAHIAGISESYDLGTTLLPHLKGWGAGVDIFFVISGFVMLHTHIRSPRTPGKFLTNRIVRIVPIYWLITLAVIAIYWVAPGLFRNLSPEPGWVAASLFFLSLLLFREMPVVSVGWTLEWEMFFYLLFAIGLFFKDLRKLVIWVALVLFPIAVLAHQWLILEFLCGMLMAYAYNRSTPTRHAAWGPWLFAVGLTLLLATLLPSVREWQWDRMVTWGLPGTLIVAGAALSPQWKNPLVQYLGAASYSIYLIHLMSLPAYYKFSARFLSGWNADVLALSCLVYSVVLGCAVYSALERPIDQRLRSLLRARQKSISLPAPA